MTIRLQCDSSKSFTMNTAIIVIIFVNVPATKGAMPGTFLWKPRLGLHLVPPLPLPPAVHPPSKDNIRDGLVVILEGYSMGITVIAVAAGYQASTKTLTHLSLWHAPFYTTAYRWGLRHFDLWPYWLSGTANRYPDTHKVWRRRYYYMDEFVPKWMRYLTPWIKNKEWEEEEKEYKRYVRYAEPTFGKHYRYPQKKFRSFFSEMTSETLENLFTKESMDDGQ